MTRWLREFRIIPVLLIAAVTLLALKSFGLVFDGGYTLGQRMSANTVTVTTVPVRAPMQMRSPAVELEVAGASGGGGKASWMQEMFNYPDITGSVAAKKETPKETPKEPANQAAKEPEKPADKHAATGEPDGKKQVPVAPPKDAKPPGTVIPIDPAGNTTSAAERALLERLQERRRELDARARELDLRDSLLKAAEQKHEAETASAKESDAKDSNPAQRKEASDNARMKAVVTMYETMKPKDAAKIFDRLDIRVLLDVATKINPRRMSEILAQMSPENAERLTVELAAKTGTERGINPSMLPKIDGKPDGG